MKKLIVILLVVLNKFGIAQESVKVQGALFSGTFTQTSNYQSFERVNELLRALESSYHMVKSHAELNEDFLADIEGSPYLNEDFMEGDIITANGELLQDIPLRFNMYDNVMEVKVKDIAYTIPSDKMIKRVLLEGRSFDFLPFVIGRKECEGYLELKFDGEIKIYQYIDVDFKQAEAPKPMQPKFKPARFIYRKPLNLVKTEDNKEAIIIKNKKQFLGIFPNQKNKMRQFFKENRGQIRDIIFLRKAVEYYMSQ